MCAGGIKGKLVWRRAAFASCARTGGPTHRFLRRVLVIPAPEEAGCAWGREGAVVSQVGCYWQLRQLPTAMVCVGW